MLEESAGTGPLHLRVTVTTDLGSNLISLLVKKKKKVGPNGHSLVWGTEMGTG